MTALSSDRALAAAVAEKLKLYAQPQRLMILSCLLGGARNVAGIGAATGIGQPALSQQLAELRRAGLVTARRESREVWYVLADEGVERCVATMEAVFGSAAPDRTAPLPGGARPQRSAVPPAPPAVAGGVRSVPGVAQFAHTGKGS